LLESLAWRESLFGVWLFLEVSLEVLSLEVLLLSLEVLLLSLEALLFLEVLVLEVLLLVSRCWMRELPPLSVILVDLSFFFFLFGSQVVSLSLGVFRS